MLNILLLCGGDQIRLGDLGYPKQLIPVAGEPLLHRTVRLCRELELPAHIGLIGRQGVFTETCLRLGISEWIVESRPMLQNIELTLRAQGLERATVLLGDVCWSRALLRAFLSASLERPTLSCARLGPSPVTGKTYGEHFGLSCTLDDLRRLDARRFYRIEDAARTNVFGAERRLVAPPGDFTEDIDTPGDLLCIAPVLSRLVEAEARAPAAE